MQTPVVIHPHPFSAEVNRVAVPEGSTLAEIVAASGVLPEYHCFLQVWIGDHQIPRELWGRVRPRNGAHVFVRAVPMGGGGGGQGGGKSFLSSILMLAVVVSGAVFAPMLAGSLGFAAGTTAFSVAQGLIGAGISMVGALLVSALIPPPKQDQQTSQRALLSGVRNQFAPYADLPRHFGKRRVYPLQAARPYTEAQGDDRYLRVLLAVGLGPLKISDIKIGDTPIEAYEAVTVETREGWHDDHAQFGALPLKPAFSEDFTGSATGWTSPNATLAQNASSITFTPTTWNPQLVSPTISVDGAANTKVRARIRRLTGNTWDGVVYYNTPGHTVFTSAYRKSIPDPIVTNGEWVIAEWDMAALTAGGTDWVTSTITKIRIDLAFDVGQDYEVDWVQVGEPLTGDTPQTIFTKQVVEDNFNVLLEDGGTGPGVTYGPWVTRTTEEGCSEISVDVTFPFGLAQFKSNGDVKELELQAEVQYRPVGGGAWSDVVWDGNDEADGTQTNGKVIGKDASRTPTTRGGRWLLPSVGQYEVRMRRISPLVTPEKSFAQRMEWTALRSIKPENPVNQPGTALIALRLKATDQLNGIPDTINCVVESYLPQWDGTAWKWDVSRNPAWAYADLARRRATTRMISDSRIKLDDMRAWAIAADATAPNAAEPYWEFNGTIERGSVFDALRLVASHGRASFTIRDGKYSVVRDIAQTVPVQHITPRNSWGYSGAKAFLDLPHALKLQIINAANGYQEDEVIVYADGYNEGNASVFESMDLPGCTSPTMAWREGRYFLAVGQLRPEEHMVTMDIEALRCTLGDYVVLSHDVISVGIAAARVAALVTAGSNTTGIVLDTVVPQVQGTAYSVRVRRETGASLLYPIAAASTSSDTDTLALASPVVTSSGPKVGDLVIYGESGLEAAPMIVKRIEPGPDMTARLTLVDAQPGVWAADTGPIPPFLTYVTDDTPVGQKRPPAPSFALASDETVLLRLADGTLQDRIGLTIGPLPPSKVPVTHYEVHFKRTEEVNWRQALVSKVGIRRAFIAPVLQGASYDVRVRTVSQYGLTSPWAKVTGHVVVGKTTPPADVAGFTAEARVDGVQLSWTPNPEVDIAGYQIRLGTQWDAGQVVSDLVTGSSFFFGLSVAGEQNFMIRAVDVTGLLSLSPAAITASLARPADVEWLQVYPQGDSVSFKWKPVEGAGVQYEIRNGSDWVTARRVTVTSGDTKAVKWPTRADASPTFMVKAVSSAGLRSLNPCVSNAPQQATENRNVVLDIDFSADTWSGNRVGMQTVGSGAGSVLAVSKGWDGLSLGRADYYRLVTLPAAYYARGWIELSALATAGAGATWNQMTMSWDAAENLTWGGQVVADADVEVTPYISVQDGSVPASLIDAMSLNSTLTSYNALAPATTGSISYAPLRPGQGVSLLGSNLQWNLTVPSVYTYVADFRFTPSLDDYALFIMGVPADPTTNPSTAAQKVGTFALMSLRWNATAVATHVRYEGATGEMVMVTSGQGSVRVAVPLEEGDMVTVAVSQGAASRTLLVYHHRLDQVFSVTDAQAAPVANFDMIRLYSAGIDRAPGVIGNVEIHNVAWSEATFKAKAPVRSLIGYSPYKEFIPGDYDYQQALVWIRAAVADRSLDLTLNPAKMVVDVPDIIRRGTVSVGTGGATVTFPAGFNTAPSVQVTQVGGATLAIARVTGLTASGFTVQLFDAAAPATAVAGTVSYIAHGY